MAVGMKVVYEDSLSLMILFLGLGMRPDMNRESQRIGLSLAEAGILLVLTQKEGRTQVEIASVIKSNKTHVMRALNNLEEQGLLVRKKTGGDNRANYVYLTEAGREKVAGVFRSFRMVDERVVDMLTNTEKKILSELLAKICKKGSILERF